MPLGNAIVDSLLDCRQVICSLSWFFMYLGNPTHSLYWNNITMTDWLINCTLQARLFRRTYYFGTWFPLPCHEMCCLSSLYLLQVVRVLPGEPFVEGLRNSCIYLFRLAGPSKKTHLIQFCRFGREWEWRMWRSWTLCICPWFWSQVEALRLQTAQLTLVRSFSVLPFIQTKAAEWQCDWHDRLVGGRFYAMHILGELRLWLRSRRLSTLATIR